jgi:hypothetical protein
MYKVWYLRKGDYTQPTDPKFGIEILKEALYYSEGKATTEQIIEWLVAKKNRIVHTFEDPKTLKYPPSK